MRPWAALGALLAVASALASGLCCRAAISVAERPEGAAQCEEVSGILVDVSLDSITLSNISAHAGRVAGAYFLPAHPPLAAPPTWQGQAAPAGSLPLDWKQRWDAQKDPGGGAPPTYSVTAGLPGGISGQEVSSVEIRCTQCGPFSCSLSSTEVGQQRGASAPAGSVVFVFQGVLGPGPSSSSSSSGGSGDASTGQLTAAARRRRRLQQAGGTGGPTPLPDCSLTVDGSGGAQTLTFQGCQQVPMQPETLYQVFYSLEPLPSGGTRWRGGLRVNASAVGGRWAGFGFPQFPASMLGSSAVIVKEDASSGTGASVAGYLLKGYTPAANVPGSFAITETAAAKETGGALVATFVADLPTAPPPDQLLAAPFDFVYAVGPLGPDGGLQPHIMGTPYGPGRMQLQQGMQGGGGSGGSPALAPAQGAVDPPADPPGNPPGGPPPSPPPPPETAAADGGGGIGGLNTKCQLSLGGSQLDFASCHTVDQIKAGYQLLWTLEPSSGSTRTLVLGLRAPAGGWVALGFPATPGHMLGATALILKACPACGSTGADIRDYFLAERSPAGVQPPGRLPVSDASAAVEAGIMQGTIKVELDSAAAANPAFPILLAAGPVDSSGTVQYHDNRGSSTLDLASGTGSGVQGESDKVRRMKNAHGWLMAVGWGVLIPLGILTARHAKRWDPLWFHIHRAIQILGLSCALAGFIIIFIAVEEASGSSVSTYTTHRSLGIAAMSMGFFQLSALVFRPHKGTRLRPYWELTHHWVGRAAAVVAVANIYEGILNVRQLGAWAVATYSVIFGLIAGTGLGLDVIKLVQRWRGRGDQGRPSAAAPALPDGPAANGGHGYSGGGSATEDKSADGMNGDSGAAKTGSGALWGQR